MRNSNIAEIKEFALSFRKGIENAVARGEISSKATKSTMPYFPKGCCEVASDLLAQYLLEKGIHTKCIHGEYDFDEWENKFPHSWLKTEDEVIIDITADQFVGKKVLDQYKKSLMM